MDSVAFALTEELQGTVSIETGEGDPGEVPVFGGGVLAVGDGDFHVRDELEAGGGTIVVPSIDATLIDLLEAYPALKRVPVPDGAEPLNPYRRRTLEDLRHIKSLRDFDGVAGASREDLEARLFAHDCAQAAGEPATVEAIRKGDTAAIAGALAGEPQDGLNGLKKSDLEDLAAENDVEVPPPGNVPDLLAALREAGIRKEA
jgi:hypothetical protein